MKDFTEESVDTPRVAVPICSESEHLAKQYEKAKQNEQHDNIIETSDAVKAVGLALRPFPPMARLGAVRTWSDALEVDRDEPESLTTTLLRTLVESVAPAIPAILAAQAIQKQSPAPTPQPINNGPVYSGPGQATAIINLVETYLRSAETLDGFNARCEIILNTVDRFQWKAKGPVVTPPPKHDGDCVVGNECPECGGNLTPIEENIIRFNRGQCGSPVSPVTPVEP